MWINSTYSVFGKTSFWASSSKSSFNYMFWKSFIFDFLLQRYEEFFISANFLLIIFKKLFYSWFKSIFWKLKYFLFLLYYIMYAI